MAVDSTTVRPLVWSREAVSFTLREAHKWLIDHPEETGEAPATTVTRVFYERFCGNARNANPLAYPNEIDFETVKGDLVRHYPITDALSKALKDLFNKPPRGFSKKEA